LCPSGRFKDELRHQQRLSDMRERCNALFDGTIRGHFQVKLATPSRREGGTPVAHTATHTLLATQREETDAGLLRTHCIVCQTRDDLTLLNNPRPPLKL